MTNIQVKGFHFHLYDYLCSLYLHFGKVAKRKYTDLDYDMLQKKPAKMSVPQFGGWEHKAQGVPTDYSMVFNQARANKKNQKTDLAEVKRLSTGNDQKVATNNANYRHGPPPHAHAHPRAHAHARPHEDPPVMVRP